jgi:outer membrane protein assembly factor BamB
MLALKAGGRGDITETHRLWEFDDGPDVPTPVTDGKYLYVVNDRGITFCLDAKSGDVIWGPRRIAAGTYSSSPVLVEDRIYVTSEDGVTTVMKAGAEFGIIAENDLESYTLPSVAVSRGQLFLRTEDFLYCIGERQ